jgi:hypothetical protein
MKQSQSTTRLILYVSVAMVSAASAGLMTVDFADHKQIAAFALSILTTGLITARSYIDKSPAEVKPHSDQI